MSNITYVTGLNGSLIDINSCSLATCPLTYAQIEYIPSKAVNMAYLIIFGLLLLAQIVHNTIYRSWGFLVGMIFGLVLEVVGYSARLSLHNDPFSFNSFVMYLVCLTIAPAFISASIYLCLSRLIVVYGEGIAPLKPKTCALTFICCDITSLILQAVGGAIAASTSDEQTSRLGVHVMMAGLACQVASVLLFIVLGAEFARRVRKTSGARMNDGFVDLRRQRMFRLLPYGLALAILTIFTRCVFRVAELNDGFSGPLANDETAFNILEGPMIIIAGLSLTILHPAACFDGAWARADWSWKTGKGKELASRDDVEFSAIVDRSKSQV